MRRFPQIKTYFSNHPGKVFRLFLVLICVNLRHLWILVRRFWWEEGTLFQENDTYFLSADYIDKNQSLVMELFGREQSGHFTLQSVFESA